MLGFTSVLTFLLLVVFVQYAYRQKVKKQLVEQRNVVLEKEKLLSDERQMRIEEEKSRAEKQLSENKLILSFFHHVSQQNLEVKNLLYDLKINNTVAKDAALHKKIKEKHENYNKEATITEVPFLPDEELHQLIGLPENDAEKLNRNDKIILLLTLMRANSSEIALLFNTTAVSIRNRKTKLRKKLLKENIHIPQEISLKFSQDEV